MVQSYARQILNQKDEDSEPRSAPAPGTIDHAALRLSDALERAEGLIARRASRSSTAHTELQEESERLQGENRRLNAQLCRLVEQYDSLRGAATGVSQRLEDSIQRVDALVTA